MPPVGAHRVREQMMGGRFAHAVRSYSNFIGCGADQCARIPNPAVG